MPKGNLEEARGQEAGSRNTHLANLIRHRHAVHTILYMYAYLCIRTLCNASPSSLFSSAHLAPSRCSP